MVGGSSARYCLLVAASIVFSLAVEAVFVAADLEMDKFNCNNRAFNVLAACCKERRSTHSPVRVYGSESRAVWMRGAER